MAAKVKKLTYAEAEEAYWTTQAIDFDATVTKSGPTVLGCSRVSLKYTRLVPATLREDVAQFSIWVAKALGATDFSVIPVSELAAMEPALDTFATIVSNQQENGWTLVEYAWHQVDENSPRTADPEHRGQKMGPATRVTPKSIVGGGTGTRLPDQVAMTATLRTCSRKHWGRMYLGGMSTSVLQVDFGRYTNAVVDAIANGLSALHDTWQTAGYQMGVWSQLHPAFLTPKTIECDDVPDIIRRRRPKQTGYRKLVN